MNSFAFCFKTHALAVAAISVAVAAGRADVLDATLVGDTYVRTSVPDKRFADSEFGLYVRNHRQHGRIALMQFTLPKWISESRNAEEIVDAQLSVMVSFTGWAERDITLELLALDRQRFDKDLDLAMLTYQDLVRDGIVADYRDGKFRYGKGVSKLQTLSLFSARGLANATLCFDSEMLLERIWEASGSNVPTLVTTIGGLRPGTTYDVSAIFIGIDPKRREMRWGIDVGFSPEELAPFGIDSEGVTATGNVTTTGTGIQVLAPIGKQAADARGEIQVYLNTSNYGPNSRTRYDGLGYKTSERP